MAPPETELLMMKLMWRQGLRVAIGLGLVAGFALIAPASAQAQIARVSSSSSDRHQAVGVTFGGFFAKGEDARADGDVLFADLDSLSFDIKDFNGPIINGEWIVGLGDYLEAGFSGGYYQQSVPSVYARSVNANGSEIEQTLKLRVVPLTATVRFLPIGHASVEPYVGAGIGAFRWRYSETGEFVDFDDVIFRANYVANGTAWGPVVVGGVRFPFGDMWDIGGELKYQWAQGDTKSAESGLLGDKIDLGGLNAAVTFHVRF
jgi:Outer membrane protein beta-barrel domain